MINLKYTSRKRKAQNCIREAKNFGGTGEHENNATVRKNKNSKWVENIFVSVVTRSPRESRDIPLKRI